MEADIRGKTYKIGQAAKLLDVKPFVLRFWESEFKDVLVPVRTPAGQRAYSEQNLDTVREIKRLLYDEGLTIEGAKKRLGQAHGPVAHEPAPSPAASTGPDSQPHLPPGTPATTQPDTQADTLREALRSVRSELSAILDLLGG